MTRKLLIMLATTLALLSSAATTAEARAPSTLQRPQLVWTTQPGSSAAGLNGAASTLDAPTAQTWGACGLITKELKVVRTYTKLGGAKVTLFCGGPKYSSHPTWGLRHIQRYHQADFEAKAVGTFQTWRQIADISISGVLADPVVAGKARDDKRCFSRYIYLWDVRNDKVIDVMIVKVVFKATGDLRIITAYPASSHCDL